MHQRSAGEFEIGNLTQSSDLGRYFDVYIAIRIDNVEPFMVAAVGIGLVEWAVSRFGLFLLENGVWWYSYKIWRTLPRTV